MNRGHPVKRPITTTQQARKARSAAWTRITGEVMDALLQPYSRPNAPDERRTAWLAGWAQLKEGRGTVGVNDAAEMLEVAKIECGRLEGEVADLTKQRDASRRVNAQFLAAQSVEVAVEVVVEGSSFRVDALPAILGNYMRLSVANSSAMKAGYLHTERIRGQRNAAEAVIGRAMHALMAADDSPGVPDQNEWADAYRVSNAYKILDELAAPDHLTATEHEAALHDTSEHYTKRPMPDGEGE